MEKYVKELFDFIEACPSPYHAVNQIRVILTNLKYIELKENEEWNLESGKKYFVVRDSASVICFKTPLDISNSGFNVVASHLDSPTFKLKPNFLNVAGSYKRLNTEPYGGMLINTWFDKPLSVAGRVLVKTNEGIEERLINLSGHSFIIPSLAIHMQRPNSVDLNLQNDLFPLVGTNGSKNDLLKQMEKIILFNENEKILAHDLFLYNKERPTTIGLDHEYLASPKLDDLECAFSSLEAFLEADNKNKFNVCAIFDNEEVGSGSNHAAKSTFLTDTLERICQAFKLDKYLMYASSMLISADNAHAIHPAHPEKSDVDNTVYMNKGIVIKYNSSLSYTTEAISSSIFKYLLDQENIPYQEYTNRSDIRGGSTLGHLQQETLSIPSVDIGLAQLAMHSSYETAGCKDLYYMVKGIKKFYESNLKFDGKKISL